MDEDGPPPMPARAPPVRLGRRNNLSTEVVSTSELSNSTPKRKESRLQVAWDKMEKQKRKTGSNNYKNGSNEKLSIRSYSSKSLPQKDEQSGGVIAADTTETSWTEEVEDSDSDSDSGVLFEGRVTWEYTGPGGGNKVIEKDNSSSRTGDKMEKDGNILDNQDLTQPGQLSSGIKAGGEKQKSKKSLHLIPKGMVLLRRANIDGSNSQKLGMRISFGRKSTATNSKPTKKPDKIPKGKVWSKRHNKLVNVRPLKSSIPQDMIWSQDAYDGEGGLIYKSPPAADIPSGWAWSRKSRDGKGGLIRLPPAPADIPPGMEWSIHADRGKGGLINKRPVVIPNGMVWRMSAMNGQGKLVNKPAAHIPPGKTWNNQFDDGKGGLVNKKPIHIPRGKRWSLSAKQGMGGLVNIANEESQNDTIETTPHEKNVKNTRRKAMLADEVEYVGKIANKPKERKLRSYRKKRRNTRNDSFSMFDIDEEEVLADMDPQNFHQRTVSEGVDLSTKGQQTVFSRKSYFEKWLSEL